MRISDWSSDVCSSDLHPRVWQLHRNKRSLTLDLRDDAHRDVFDALVRESDVVLENSRPGVMAKLGYDYAALRKLKSDIIMVSMSAFGCDGPYAPYAGYGGTLEAICGIQDLTAYAPDGRPYRVREVDVTNGMEIGRASCRERVCQYV